LACLLLLSLSHPLSRLENTGILLSREHWNTRLILCFCYDNGFAFCKCVNCMWYRSRLYRCVATLKCLHFLHGNLSSNGIQNGKATVAKCAENLLVSCHPSNRIAGTLRFSCCHCFSRPKKKIFKDSAGFLKLRLLVFHYTDTHI
jgi:hypothetical protein